MLSQKYRELFEKLHFYLKYSLECLESLLQEKSLVMVVLVCLKLFHSNLRLFVYLFVFSYLKVF